MRDGGAASYFLVQATKTSRRAAVPPYCRGTRMKVSRLTSELHAYRGFSGWAGLGWAELAGSVEYGSQICRWNTNRGYRQFRGQDAAKVEKRRL